MKRLLYAVLGLFLFGIHSPLSLKAQVNNTINYGEKGYFAPLGWLSSPKSSKYVSGVYPATPTTTKDFYYVNGQGQRVDFSVGNSNGGNFTAGVGLNVSNNVISLNQWPQIAGTLGVSGLFFDPNNPPPLITPANMVTNNGHLLGLLNNQAVRVNLADYHNYLKTIITGGGGEGSGLKWVKPPKDQNAPGTVGEYSYYLDNFYFYAQTGPLNYQWLQWPVNTTFLSGYEDTDPGNAPPVITSAQYNPFTQRINVSWTTTLTNVESWQFFVAYNGGNYQPDVAGIPAGNRTDVVFPTSGNGEYKILIRARLSNGSVSSFSNEKTVTVAPGGAEFLPVTNVVLTPLNDANAIKVDFTTQDNGGEATLLITTNGNASPTSDDSWGNLGTVTVGNAGNYSYTFTGINDQNARWIKIYRSGTGKAQSTPQKFGPVSLTAVNEPVNKPTITSITANSAGTAATVNLVANNTNFTWVDLYRSEDGGNTYEKLVAVGPTNTSFTDANRTPGKTYFYKAQVLKNNTYSPFSDAKSITMPGAPVGVPTPFIYRASGGGSQGSNSETYLWSTNGVTPSNGLTGFYADRRKEGEVWTRKSPTQTQFSPSISPDIYWDRGEYGYYERRRVVTSNGESAWSDVIYFSQSGNKILPPDQTPTGQAPPSAQPLQFSATSVTESSITVSIINPSNSGTINYNWSIYAGDPNTANAYRCSKYDNPSSGTLTISTSACTNLIAGQQYRLYFAQSNGQGQPQTRQSYITFTQPGNQGGGGGSIQWGVVPNDPVAPPGGIYFMENSQLRIGLNMNAGGAIWEAYHADEPQTQLVNDADYGRQWQYAYYGHPTEGYKPNGKDPGNEVWNGIGYDPIQAGDFTAPSRVLQFKEDKANGLVYFRTRPRLWGYADIEAPCYVDTWIRITGNFVEFRNICYNERVNDPQYVNLPRGQDIGGAFANGKYYESNVYMGNKPWTDGPIVARRILFDFPFDHYVEGPKHPDGQWVYPDKGDYGRTLKLYNPERWVTLRNPESGKFIGLWSQSPTFNHQTGGREQGKWDGQYGGPYVTMGTMQEPATMAKRTVLDYEYTYMIGGNPQGMRNYAYGKRDFKNVIDWNFSTGTSDWSMNNRDQAEPPFDGSWYAPGNIHQMNRVSPDIAVDASKYTHVQVRMAVGGNQQKAGISFLKRKDNGLLYDHDDIPYQFDVIADGQMRTYEIDLRTNPNYNGILYRIYLDVFGQPQAGRWSRVEFVKGIYRP